MAEHYPQGACGIQVPHQTKSTGLTAPFSYSILAEVFFDLTRLFDRFARLIIVELKQLAQLNLTVFAVWIRDTDRPIDGLLPTLPIDWLDWPLLNLLRPFYWAGPKFPSPAGFRWCPIALREFSRRYRWPRRDWPNRHYFKEESVYSGLCSWTPMSPSRTFIVRTGAELLPH